MKKILIVKHNYSDYSDERNEFLRKATEADSLWNEVTEKEFEEIQKLVDNHNKHFRYSEQPCSVYELFEYVDPKSILTNLADELRQKAQENIEREKKLAEKLEKRKKTLEAKKLEKKKLLLEKLKSELNEAQ